MRETTFYERLLGIERPWRMHDVRLALEQGDIVNGYSNFPHLRSSKIPPPPG